MKAFNIELIHKHIPPMLIKEIRERRCLALSDIKLNSKAVIITNGGYSRVIIESNELNPSSRVNTVRLLLSNKETANVDEHKMASS
jgi:hypothetical protein